MLKLKNILNLTENTPILKSWEQLRQEHDDKSEHHHLRLECKVCGNVSTCRCMDKKITLEGICPDCMKKRENK